ncbi:MAG: bifunctional demethylmenaquinone methyltransferase/2-methoxy-6-polyprenyl-1,4-benzoquinol methylase UbiE [Lutibacter sp.]
MTKIKPYKNSDLGKKDQVTKMFDTISHEYDGLNRVISFGIDVRWRNKVVKIIKNEQPKTVLDIATGTGDLAINLVKTGAEKIIGADISKGMLAIGEEKIKKLNLKSIISLKVADSENLPFENSFFDAITVAFGVRNFENLEKGLTEIYRVLKPGGTFVVLETSVPTKFPFKQGYHIYTAKIMPFIGKLFSKDKVAYQYLADSAANFPYGKKFNNILKKIGFIGIEDFPQTMGVASIYVAKK